jgi:mannosyltransferase
MTGISIPTQGGSGRSTEDVASQRAARWIISTIAGLTLVGLAIRVVNFDQALLGDELSTYWIVNGRSLGDVLSSVRSDNEITPPLFFVLGWLSLQPDWGPEWVRLPSLIAGTATIPLVYLLGARTVGRVAGLLGAAVIALSPFMIYYSTEARAYAVMIVLLVGSTLALLAALRTGRARWWVAYAACSCAAMLSHYTAAFPLAAQFAWVLWAHREAWRALLLANLGALVGFAPWLGGFIADNNSPTTEILSVLAPFTFDWVKTSLQGWAFGYPYIELGSLPGNLATALLVAGILVAAIAAALRGLAWMHRSQLGPGAALRRIPPPVVLVVALALAAPVGEALYSALGSDIFGARNLNPSWPGLALAIGALLAAAGPVLGVVCAAAVLSGFAIGAARTVDADNARPDLRRAAELIEQRWRSGDVVVDAQAFTPVPLTALGVYLPQTNPEYRLGLPESDRPFTVLDPVPPPGPEIADALEDARGGSLFLVAATPDEDGLIAAQRVAESRRQRTRLGARVLRRAQPRWQVVFRQTLPGLDPITVVELRKRGGRG